MTYFFFYASYLYPCLFWRYRSDHVQFIHTYIGVIYYNLKVYGVRLIISINWWWNDALLHFLLVCAIYSCWRSKFLQIQELEYITVYYVYRQQILYMLRMYIIVDTSSSFLATTDFNTLLLSYRYTNFVADTLYFLANIETLNTFVLCSRLHMYSFVADSL